MRFSDSIIVLSSLAGSAIAAPANREKRDLLGVVNTFGKNLVGAASTATSQAAQPWLSM